MSYGFQVFDEDGVLVLDDKTFIIIGREATLSGSGSFPVYSGFVAIGVSGNALVGKGLRWHVGDGSVHYFIQGGGSLDVVIFEESGESSSNPAMGLEILAESGLITFSSGDIHFEVISQTQVWNYLDYYTETLNTETIYILHSSRIAAKQWWGTPFGTVLGVDALSANSQSILVEPEEIGFAQGTDPSYIEYIAGGASRDGAPSSQLLRVRAK